MGTSLMCTVREKTTHKNLRKEEAVCEGLTSWVYDKAVQLIIKDNAIKM